MSPVENYPVNVHSIETRLSVLKKRQRHLTLWSLMFALVFVTGVIASFGQQTLVYSFFDLTRQVEQLHIPVAMGDQLVNLEQPDYFTALLSWFGWLVLKLFASFIGAFFFVGFLKKIHFFQIRFHSLILRFVAWLIGLILIWSGLTYLQYDLKNDDAKIYEQLVDYDRTIRESEIAQYLRETDAPVPVKDYLLAQTALLHRPVDKDAALPYVTSLIRAERLDPHFMEYGFKPEQLWAMQQQMYGKTVTPLAQQVQQQAIQAERVSGLIQLLCWGISIFAALFAVVFYGLSHNLKNRTLRIEQKN